ncbi:hypothetical protein C0992_001185 [Termitomyces sp. T32_za158]|nr:hypothetical protein C0992_001185 [Termitomyces sp. T32_za158]
MDTLLQALLRENKILRNENTFLKLEAQVREEELAKFRSEYSVKRFNAAVRKHIIGSMPEGRKRSPSQLSYPLLKLHQPAETTMGEDTPGKGVTTDLIQPNSILASSSKPIPTVSATKAQDYPEAMTCRTIPTIKDPNNVARTPRAPKVYESMKKRDLNSYRSSNSILGHGERKMKDKQPKTESSTLTPTTASCIPSSSGGSTLGSTSHTPVSLPLSRGRILTPLASEIFKDEIKESLSRVKRSPIKKLRSLLNEVDINRTDPRVDTRSLKQPIKSSSTSAKAIRKTKAILLERSTPDSAIEAHNNFSSGGRNDGTEFHRPPVPMLATSTTYSAEDSEAFSAEKALLSLERICAGFSSGSLGSLESTADPSPANVPLPDVPSLFVVDTATEAKNLLPVRSASPEPPSFSRLSVKTSTPLVSRYPPSTLASPFHPATKPSLKPVPHSTKISRKSTSPMRLTKVTDVISSSPPKKKAIYKHTSPLRIAKKKGGVSARPSPDRF